MEPQTVIVTGANRGIGLEFTKQYLHAGYHVVGTYRNEKTLDALKALQKEYPTALSLKHLEVKDYAEIESFSKTITKVDLLILNAGIKGYPTPGTDPTQITPQQMDEAHSVNTTGPDHIIRMLYPLLSKQEDACVAYMSSLVAEPTDNTGGNYHPYRDSKLAMNGSIWNWAIKLMSDWCKAETADLSKAPCAVAICPGWVKTDMGGPNARLTPEESVSRMRNVIETVRRTKECNELYMHDGEKKVHYPITADLKKIIDAVSQAEQNNSKI